MKHVLSARQFSKKELTDLFAKTDLLYKIFNSPGGRQKLLKKHRGRTLAALFYEPSTRTRMSFEAAAHCLGLSTLSTENALEFLSAKKGESIQDTARVLSNYADVIIIRHPGTDTVDEATLTSKAAIINAGDGKNEHPTQALLDLYTIKKEKGVINGLKIGIIGELFHSRTLHSLVYILANYDVEFFLISPKDIKLPSNYTEYLRSKGKGFHETESLDKVITKLDVIYINRVQRERHENQKTAGPSRYVIKLDSLKRIKPDAIIMNPLPRVDEIDPQVDTDPRAAYFRQAENGLFVRMALLDKVLSDNT